MRWRTACFALSLAALAFGALACGNNGVPIGGADLASSDLASSDLAVAGARDFAGVDLEGYSGAGGPCGGFTQFPKQCLPGLVCVNAQVPDAPGTCANPDAGMCKVNGDSCSTGGDCCSGNCILRGGNPGFCCEPGGCP